MIEHLINKIYNFFGITYLTIMKKYNVLPFKDFQHKRIPHNTIIYADPSHTNKVMLAIQGHTIWVDKLNIYQQKKIIKSFMKEINHD